MNIELWTNGANLGLMGRRKMHIRAPHTPATQDSNQNWSKGRQLVLSSHFRQFLAGAARKSTLVQQRHNVRQQNGENSPPTAQATKKKTQAGLYPNEKSAASRAVSYGRRVGLDRGSNRMLHSGSLGCTVEPRPGFMFQRETSRNALHIAAAGLSADSRYSQTRRRDPVEHAHTGEKDGPCRLVYRAKPARCPTGSTEATTYLCPCLRYRQSHAYQYHQKPASRNAWRMASTKPRHRLCLHFLESSSHRFRL